MIQKCNKKWWDSFLLISLGLNRLPGSCAGRTHSISELKYRVLKFKFLAENDGEKWPRIFYFEIHQVPSELLLPSAKKAAH